MGGEGGVGGVGVKIKSVLAPKLYYFLTAPITRMLIHMILLVEIAISNLSNYIFLVISFPDENLICEGRYIHTDKQTHMQILDSIVCRKHASRLSNGCLPAINY